MFDYLKKAVNHSVLYGISNSLVNLAGLLLLPIYAKYLSPEEFGVFTTINISGAILGIIYDMGLIGSLNSHYFDYSEAEELDRKLIASTILIFYFLFSSISTIILFFFSGGISALLFKGDNEYSDIVRLMLIITYINLLTGVPLSIVRLKQKAFAFMFISFLRVSSLLIFSLLFLIFLKESLFGLYKAQIISSAAALVVVFLLTHNDFIFKFSLAQIKKMLAYGLTYFPTIIFVWVINFSDRYLLNYFSTLEEVGIYSFGYKIAQIVYIFVISLLGGWNPILFSIVKEDNAKEILSRMMTYFFLVVSSLVLFISIFSEEIVTVVSVGKYVESYRMVPIVSLSYLLYGVYVFLFCGLMVTKKIKSQPIIIGISAFINIILNIILIPKFGYMGAALSTLFTYCVVVIGTYVVSQKHFYISYEMIRLFKITAVAFFIYFMHYYKIFNYVMLAGIFGNLVLFMLFFYILYILRFFDLTEINKIKSIFRPIILKGI